MDDARLRIRESPLGGSRIAFSYLGALLAAMAAGLLTAMASPFAPAICATTDDVTCLLGWTFGSAIVAAVAAFAVVAWVLRLGWEWWAVVAAVLLSSPWWSGLVPGWALPVVVLLAPGIAGATTLTGRRRPAWRPWVVGAVCVALVALGVVSILV